MTKTMFIYMYLKHDSTLYCKNQMKLSNNTHANTNTHTNTHTNSFGIYETICIIIIIIIRHTLSS